MQAVSETQQPIEELFNPASDEYLKTATSQYLALAQQIGRAHV